MPFSCDRSRRFRCGHDQDSLASRLAVESSEGDEVKAGADSKEEEEDGEGRKDEEEEEKEKPTARMTQKRRVSCSAAAAACSSSTSFDPEDDPRAQSSDEEEEDRNRDQRQEEDDRLVSGKKAVVREKFCFHQGIQAFREHQQCEEKGANATRSGSRSSSLHSNAPSSTGGVFRTADQSTRSSGWEETSRHSSFLRGERGRKGGKREASRSEESPGVSSSATSSASPVLVASRAPDACRCVCRVIGHKNLLKFCVATQDSELRERLR